MDIAISNNAAPENAASDGVLLPLPSESETAWHKFRELNWLSLLLFRIGLVSSEAVAEEYFSLEGKPLCEDELDFLDDLSESARTIVEAIDEKGIEKYSSPISLHLHLSRDKLTLYGCIFPNIGSGWKLPTERMYNTITDNGIVFGVREGVFESILENKSYMKIFVVASGIPKKDGIDGEIIDLYSRETKIKLETNGDDDVDYKNLNWLQTVHEGDIICKLVRPTAGEDGTDLYGLPIKAYNGKMPKIPAGNNTSVTEDGLALVATADGQLSFKGNCFRVDSLLKIDGNVDTAVGNLDVIGSVSINGDVTEGFSIIATGDIIVRGIVEGAYLKAGGSIQVFHGMNGNSKGRLEAGGNINIKYLENCYVSAKGFVKCCSIINSTVVSSDKVSVIMGKGIIVGSNITGFKGIDARSIGNEHNRLTTLTVGSNPILLDELNTLRKEVADLEHTCEENKKNIAYLENTTNLDEKYKQLLNKLKLDQSVNSMKLNKKKQRLIEINEELSDVDGQISAIELYPPANITMGKLKLTITQLERMCRLYNQDGQIIVGKR